MLRKLLFKSIWLNVIGIGMFILLTTLADHMTLYAQTGVIPSEPTVVFATPQSSGAAPARPTPKSDSGYSPLAPWPKYWYAIAGAVFLPANSDYSYQYGNSGCLKSNSPGYWRASVNLPDGSVAKYLYINYYNGMLSANSTAWLTRYKYNGDFNDLISVNSRNYTTTNIGYFLDLSAEFTETIDNLNYNYTFIWNGSTTQRLCAVRLGYYPPSGFGAMLPLIMK